ncbi:dnaJ homolog subfamily C member 9 isoform 2-T2 [Pangshura tecta]
MQDSEDYPPSRSPSFSIVSELSASDSVSVTSCMSHSHSISPVAKRKKNLYHPATTRDKFVIRTSRLQKEITIKDIEDFEKKYKGSEEELADVKAAYEDFKGDIDKIMESVLCVDYTDEPRIRKIIQQAIDSGEVPSYKVFVKESKQKMNARKRRAQEEAKEAEKTREELGLGDGEDDLKALIQSRNKDRKKEIDDFLAQMEAKYGNNSKKGGKKTAPKKAKK